MLALCSYSAANLRCECPPPPRPAPRYATHWPPAYIIESTTGISERPCCFTAEICQPNMPLTARDDLFKCPTGYWLQYRSPIAGSDFESGTAYDKCADLVSICEENYNATWCSS